MYCRSSSSRCGGSTTASKEIVDTLGALHRLSNTYIVFTSDNGFFFGEHRLAGGKFLAYEPSTHLPLLIRGPGIKPGSSTGELAANTDIAPTDRRTGRGQAGHERRRPLAGSLPARPSLRSRRPILFESFVETSDVEENGGAAAAPTSPAPRPGGGRQRATAGPGGARASLLAPPKDYEGIRLGPYKYIAWPTGEKELYDINKDPNELNNLAKVPNYFPVRNFLDRGNEAPRGMLGQELQEAGGEIPLTRKELRRATRTAGNARTQGKEGTARSKSGTGAGARPSAG